MGLDSIDRLVNLEASVEFLLKHFDTNIHILEADQLNTGLIQSVVSPCVSVKPCHKTAVKKLLVIFSSNGAIFCIIYVNIPSTITKIFN